MTDQKNSHKGGHAGTRVRVEANDGHIEKNKTRVKYKTSIPLQEYQALAKSNNLDNMRTGTGNKPRCGSRAPSEASDPGENDISLINSHIQSDKTQPTEDNSMTLNLHKRQAMEEEDGLDMGDRPKSRLVTPSPSSRPPGHEVNKMPKAKSRVQPPKMTNPYDLMDKESSEMGGYQDLQMTNKEELMCDRIYMKLEDALDELKTAKQSPIWTKLEFIELWVDHISNLVGSPRGSDMDKLIIANLAKTNTYLTRKIVNLELKNNNPTPEIIQPQPTHEPQPARKSTPTLTQPSWAQVATEAHTRS